MRQLPHEEIVYIGDSARAPYGPRPAEQIREYTWELVNFLLTQNVKMIVFACNTATAVAWEAVKENWIFLFWELFCQVLAQPLNQLAMENRCDWNADDNQVGYLSSKIKSLAPQMNVTSLSCPKFAPLVESNEMTSSVAKKVVYETLAPLVGKVDTLVLGCTHYPLLRPIIQNVMGPNVKLIDSGAECIRDVSVLLNYFEINRSRTQDDVTHAFYTTASSQSFKEIAVNWLAKDIDVQHVDLKKLNK